MTFPTRRAVFLAAITICLPAFAQTPLPAHPETVASQAVVRKLNAYVGLMNRTLRASESVARYESWVNMRTGPTGRESIVYGLYSLYDVRGEIEGQGGGGSRAPDARARRGDPALRSGL